MTTPFIGEIRMFGFGSRGAPTGWQACDGSLLAISEYDTLYALIGTTYGGNGQTTCAVPDLRGRAPIHQGQGPGLSSYPIGQRAGTEQVTLLAAQLPAHTHGLIATSSGSSAATPGPTLLPGAVSGESFYVDDITGAAPINLSAQSLGATGGNQPHENCMPTLTVQFCIALYGIFPSQG